MAARAAAKPAVAAGTNLTILKDKVAIDLVERYAAAKGRADAAKSEMDELKPKIAKLMDGSPVAYCGTRTLTYTSVPALPDRPAIEITKAMIGQIIPAKKGKAGYDMLRVN